MKKLLMFLTSIVVIVYAFYLRVEYGSAGLFVLVTIPAMFYIGFRFTYYVRDYKKNKYVEYLKGK